MADLEKKVEELTKQLDEIKASRDEKDRLIEQLRKEIGHYQTAILTAYLKDYGGLNG